MVVKFTRKLLQDISLDHPNGSIIGYELYFLIPPALHLDPVTQSYDWKVTDLHDDPADNFP